MPKEGSDSSRPSAIEPVLNYASPQPLPPCDAPIYSIPILIASWILLITVLSLALFVVPRLESIYRDFGTELPGVTKMILTISRWIARGPAGIALVIVACLLPFVRTIIRNDERASGRERVMVITLLGMCGLLILISIVGLLLPMLALVRAISGSSSL